MVWIFQEGHLSGPLHFTAQPLDTSMLVLLFCIAFGPSVDYEVIVFSRIKELHDQGRDNRAAVTDGLTRSGRIVTAAAARIAVTFFAFGTATVSFLQLSASAQGSRRAKALARAGDRAGGRTARQSRFPRPAETAN